MLKAPFPTLWTPAGYQITDSHTPDVRESEANDEEVPLGKIALSWNNLTRQECGANWMGSNVGTKSDYGPTSTASNIVAEIGRQAGPGLSLYRILSLVTTQHVVALTVECDITEQRKLLCIHNLQQGGGQPFAEGLIEQARRFGLL